MRNSKSTMSGSIPESRTMEDNPDFLLRQVLRAWDRLKAGNYHPRVVEEWLVDDMAPVIQKVRERINRAGS